MTKPIAALACWMLSLSALATEPVAPPPPPPVVIEPSPYAAPPSSIPPASSQPAAVQPPPAVPPPAAPYYADSAPRIVLLNPHPSRVRWGIDATLGYMIPTQGFAFGATARVGAQIFDALGVYADFGAFGALGFAGNFSGSGGGASISLAGMGHLSAMVEGDFAKFFIAGGPMVAFGGLAFVNAGGDSSGNASTQAVLAGGWMPGFDVRTGFTFGDRMYNGRRSGFTLAIDVKVVAATVVTVETQSTGAPPPQTYAVGDRVWGVAPMLVLGYDSK